MCHIQDPLATCGSCFYTTAREWIGYYLETSVRWMYMHTVETGPVVEWAAGREAARQKHSQLLGLHTTGAGGAQMGQGMLIVAIP